MWNLTYSIIKQKNKRMEKFMMLEKRFEEELVKACEIAQKEYGYNATRFLNTISKFGGVKQQKKL